MRGLLHSALWAVLAYLLVVALLYVFQGRLFYYPLSTIIATPDDYGLDYEEVWLLTEDNVRLHAWYLPAADESAPALLFFHGNAGNIGHRLDSLRTFSELGLAVLILDYRGYGRSEGRPSEEGIHHDAQAGWRYLRETRGEEAQNIVLFGRSLGASVAAWLAAREKPGAVILESAFTSAADLGAEIYPWLPVRLLLRYEYDTLSAVRNIDAPLLIAHSPEDEIVPFDHGRRLYEAAEPPRAFLEMRGGHNDGFLVTGEGYRTGLADFLDRVFETPASQGQLMPSD